MINITDKAKCCGCGACAKSCSAHCIQMVADAEGFLYPQIKQTDCIGCGVCDNVCPIIHNNPKNQITTVFAARNKEETIQSSSSSGGIFYSLAKHFLKSGVVYAAAFNEEFVLEHRRVKSIEDLKRFIGSKYVQSDLRDTFSEIEAHLKQGIEVLFVGTPCQVAGLKNFLIKEYSNLFTVDFICHGVPSPKVFDKYLKFVCKSKTPTEVSFRDKTNGWVDFSMRFGFDGEPAIINSKKEDLFLRGFFDNIFLRPSCHQCAFKSLKKFSDITLADFWGIKRVLPDFYDKQGISAVLLNSDRGEVFESVKGNLVYCETDVEGVINTNTALLQAAKPSNTRELFFKELDMVPIDKNLQEALVPGIKTRIKMKVMKTKRA